MADQSAVVKATQHDKENVDIDSTKSVQDKNSKDSLLAKDDGDKVELLTKDDEGKSVPAPKPKESVGGQSTSDVELKSNEDNDASGKLDDQTPADEEVISDNQTEHVSSSVASPQNDTLTVFPTSKDLESETVPSTPTTQTDVKIASSNPANDTDHEDDDAVFVSSSDLVGHDPSLDTPTSQPSSSRRSGNKAVEFTKRLSFKGVSEGLRRTGSRLSDKTPGSERGSMDVQQEKRMSLDKVQEKSAETGEEKTGTVEADKSGASTPGNESKDHSGVSTPTGGPGPAGRPAFRARVSASAEGVKRAVLGSRKDSAGSVKKVEGQSMMIDGR